MKIDKKKTVFVSIVIIVIIFIVCYSMIVVVGDAPTEFLDQPIVPELKEDQHVYDSKLEAINDLKEEREHYIPKVYSEELLDSLGYYDPELGQKKRELKIDSIYQNGFYEDDPETYQVDNERVRIISDPPDKLPERVPISIQDMAVGHETFFHTGEISKTVEGRAEEHRGFRVQTYGEQTVRSNDRLELILLEPVRINGMTIPRNRLLYGFVTLQPNRVQIKITHIAGQEVKMAAYDLQDYNQGIYVRNSFHADAGREVLDDVVQDVNIAGFPSIRGIKNIFRRNNRNIKVTIMDRYQLILKKGS